MKIDVNKWQDTWTGELAEIYLTFYDLYNKGEFVASSRVAKKFMDKFSELYNSIELLRQAREVLGEYNLNSLNKSVADFKKGED